MPQWKTHKQGWRQSLLIIPSIWDAEPNYLWTRRIHFKASIPSSHHKICIRSALLAQTKGSSSGQWDASRKPVTGQIKARGLLCHSATGTRIRILFQIWIKSVMLLLNIQTPSSHFCEVTQSVVVRGGGGGGRPGANPQLAAPCPGSDCSDIIASLQLFPVSTGFWAASTFLSPFTKGGGEEEIAHTNAMQLS